MKKLLLTILLSMFGVIGYFSETFASHAPAAPSLRGIGGANVQAIEADFRAMEQAALLFFSDNPGSLAPGVNYADLLARYTDVPTRFGDSSRYGFLADSRGWWAGISISGTDLTREHVADAAGRYGWLGSSDTSIPPGDSIFNVGDSVVWKFLR